MNQAVLEPQTQFWRLSVEQYHQMIDSGILTEDDPVELLQGWLITKMPKNPPHILSTELLRDELEPLLPRGWRLNFQQPITTSNSEPEPVVSIIRGARRDYATRLAGPADVGLVVEVSDSTLKNDKGLKLEVYAQAGISEYWVVNLPERRLEVYTSPLGNTYQKQEIYTEDQSVPVVLDGVLLGEVGVKEFLP